MSRRGMVSTHACDDRGIQRYIEQEIDWRGGPLPWEIFLIGMRLKQQAEAF